MVTTYLFIYHHCPMLLLRCQIDISNLKDPKWVDLCMQQKYLSQYSRHGITSIAATIMVKNNVLITNLMNIDHTEINTQTLHRLTMA